MWTLDNIVSKNLVYVTSLWLICRIDTTSEASVAERMMELFKRHNNLLVGFNVFLPKEYEISLPLQDGQPHHNEPTKLVEGKTLLSLIHLCMISNISPLVVAWSI